MASEIERNMDVILSSIYKVSAQGDEKRYVEILKALDSSLGSVNPSDPRAFRMECLPGILKDMGFQCETDIFTVYQDYPEAKNRAYWEWFLIEINTVLCIKELGEYPSDIRGIVDDIKHIVAKDNDASYMRIIPRIRDHIEMTMILENIREEKAKGDPKVYNDILGRLSSVLDTEERKLDIISDSNGCKQRLRVVYSNRIRKIKVEEEDKLSQLRKNRTLIPFEEPRVRTADPAKDYWEARERYEQLQFPEDFIPDDDPRYADILRHRMQIKFGDYMEDIWDLQPVEIPRRGLPPEIVGEEDPRYEGLLRSRVVKYPDVNFFHDQLTMLLLRNKRRLTVIPKIPCGEN